MKEGVEDGDDGEEVVWEERRMSRVSS